MCITDIVVCSCFVGIPRPAAGARCNPDCAEERETGSHCCESHAYQGVCFCGYISKCFGICMRTANSVVQMNACFEMAHAALRLAWRPCHLGFLLGESFCLRLRSILHVQAFSFLQMFLRQAVVNDVCVECNMNL
jgi:hypothetical protein